MQSTSDVKYTPGAEEPIGECRGVSTVKPIEAAKEAVSVEDLAEMLSGPGLEHGDEILFVCPLHDDHFPSLRVNPGKGVWHCFPCGIGGDVVRLAQLAWDYPDDGPGAATAAAMLLMEFGFEVPQRPPSWSRKQERQRPVRDVIEDARVEVHMRRLWNHVVGPILAELEDDAEREEMGDWLWSLLRSHVKRGRARG